MSEIATVLKDGLIEDGKEETYHYMAEVNDIRCRAISNFFTRTYYVDNVYGVLRERNLCT